MTLRTLLIKMKSKSSELRSILSPTIRKARRTSSATIRIKFHDTRLLRLRFSVTFTQENYTSTSTQVVPNFPHGRSESPATSANFYVAERSRFPVGFSSFPPLIHFPQWRDFTVECKSELASEISPSIDLKSFFFFFGLKYLLRFHIPFYACPVGLVAVPSKGQHFPSIDTLFLKDTRKLINHE